MRALFPPALKRILRTLSLTAVVLVVAAPDARAQADTPAAQRARKLAAKRYQGGPVSLPESAFAAGLRVCARETPSGITGYWKVPPKAVDAIDTDLLRELRKSGADARLPFAAKLYVRQYVGYVRDGVRYVYINAVLVEKGSAAFDQAQKAFPASCENLASWGIQYDTQAKKFVGFTAK